MTGQDAARIERAGGAAAPRSERSVIAYLAFMGILLAFGIDASLPAFDDLARAFDLPEDSNRISLVVTAYFIGMATGQLVYGPLSDRFGRRSALLAGVGLYCLGTVGAILAPGFGALLGARLAWGLGAAACAVLRPSIARDLYEGDQMARVISIMMGAFMAGPILAPIAGQWIVGFAGWRGVFAAALILAAVQVVWTLRFGETLAPEHRRPMRLADTIESFRVVFTTPATARYTVALTFSFGGFIIFLGSSQPVIDDIYGRGEQFAFWFAVASIAMVVSFLTVNRFIVLYGSARVAMASALVSLATSVALLVACLAGDGVPSFAAWFGLLGIGNAFGTLLTPTCYSLGLAPMGDRAGIASGVMGFASAAGGSILAGLVSTRIADTVTPMAVGYVLYGTITVAALWWAATAAPATPAPPARSTAEATAEVTRPDR